MSDKKLIEKRWFKILLCFVAFFGMAFLAVYQRVTGPTHPLRVHETLASRTVSGKLVRSHPGAGGAIIELETPDDSISGQVVWRRYPTEAAWQSLPMHWEDGTLSAELPHQPPAGKLEYSVQLQSGREQLVVPEGPAVIIRYRGDVPPLVLIPHIICMFLALTVVLRSGLGLLLREERIERLIKWVLIFLLPGGLVLGPMVQKYAFGAYWTGWPFGDDWTDNKTAAAFLAWIVAWLVARYWPRFLRPAMAVAFVVMIAVYLIPHSANGSEIDWDEIDSAEAEAAQIGPESSLERGPLTADVVR